MNNHLKEDPRYQNHESRPDLAGEHPVGDTYQMIALLIFIAVVILDFFLLGNPQKIFGAVQPFHEFLPSWQHHGNFVC